MITRSHLVGLALCLAATAQAGAQTHTLEAETGQLRSPMQALNGAIYSPTRYRGDADYTLEVPAEGRYELQLRTRSDAGGAAKIAVRVGARSLQLRLQDLGPDFAWQTHKKAAFRDLKLERGPVQVTLSTLDAGVHVDALRLIAVELSAPAPEPEPEPTPRPDESAPPAGTSATIEAETGALKAPLAALGGAISTPQSYRGSATYTLQVPAAGKYDVELRARSEERGTYRIRTRLAGRGRELKLQDEEVGVFAWHTDRNAKLREVQLEQGSVTLELYNLEQGVHVDALRLIAVELDPASPPSAPTAPDAPTGADPALYAPPPAVVAPSAGPEALLNHLVGFARGASGGYGGSIYRVTTLADSGAGSLRAGAESSSARWIVFDVSGTIRLDSPLKVGDDTTIDGRGQRITITGHGIAITKRKNVILHNLEVREVKDDAVKIYQSERVWVDHLSLSRAEDGLLDITEQSTGVTVSWCRLEEHNKTMLIGANNSRVADKAIHVTLHHNYFFKTIRRNPAVRYARVHLFNNVFSQWGEGSGGDCVAATYESQLLLENNVFDPTLANRRALRVTVGQYIEVPGFVARRGNLLLGGAELFEREPTRVFDPAALYDYAAQPATALSQDEVVYGAGRQDVPRW